MHPKKRHEFRFKKRTDTPKKEIERDRGRERERERERERKKEREEKRIGIQSWAPIFWAFLLFPILFSSSAITHESHIRKKIKHGRREKKKTEENKIRLTVISTRGERKERERGERGEAERE